MLHFIIESYRYAYAYLIYPILNHNKPSDDKCDLCMQPPITKKHLDAQEGKGSNHKHSMFGSHTAVDVMKLTTTVIPVM